MAGRTTSKYAKFIIDAFDFSTYFAMSDGLTWAFDAPELHGAADAAKGYLPNQAKISPGNLTGVYDTTATTGPHVNLNGSAVKRTVSIALGSLAAPLLGDPVFGGSFYQSEYTLPLKPGMVPMTVPFPGWAADGATLLYANPWGVVLNPGTARTGTSVAIGTDNPTAGSTLFGGYLVYHVTAGDGTATLKVQDASASNLDASFADLASATTGSINCAVAQSGVIAIGRTATVRRWLRYQIVLGTATTVSFWLSFFRAYW